MSLIEFQTQLQQSSVDNSVNINLHVSVDSGGISRPNGKGNETRLVKRSLTKRAVKTQPGASGTIALTYDDVDDYLVIIV